MWALPRWAIYAWLLIGLNSSGEISIPRWKHLSSRNGDLPQPSAGNQQTACVIFDVDGDKAAEIVVAERTKAPAITFLRFKAGRWGKYVIDDTHQTPEAGGTSYDVDGDSDLDLIIGGDWQSNELWWYENPFPKLEPATPWKRRLIKKGSGTAHHDQAIADFTGSGRAQLMFWNQGARKLFMAGVPDQPLHATSWPLTEMLDTSKIATANKQEGTAAFDIDGDGKIDLLAGIFWFKHLKEDSFQAIRVCDHPGRIAAGHFKRAKVAQIVVAPGDGNGPLLFVECAGDPLESSSWKTRDLLGRELIHGHTLEVADINGDGYLDIFTAEMAKWTERKPEPDNPQAHAWILYGDGHGKFHTTVFKVGFGFHEGRVADVNGDGRLDIISKPYNWDAPRIDIWLNEGSSN